MITHSDASAIEVVADLHVQPLGSAAELVLSFRLETKAEVQQVIDLLIKVREQLAE